jgi:hypothetical protein
LRFKKLGQKVHERFSDWCFKGAGFTALIVYPKRLVGHVMSSRKGVVERKLVEKNSGTWYDC